MITRLCAILLCLLSLILLSCECAYAIPAFARREGVECQMCHFRMPELNQDGYNYAMRGLREERIEIRPKPECETGEEETSSEQGESSSSSGQAGNAESSKQGDESETMGNEANSDEQDIDPIPAAEPRPLGEPLFLKWANYLTIMGHHMFVAESNERPLFDAGEIDIWAAGPINPNWTGLVNPSFDIEEGGSDVDQGYGQYISSWSEQFVSGRFGQLVPFAILFNQGGPKMPLSDPLVLSVPGDTGYGWTPESQVRGVEFGAVSLAMGTIYLGIGQPNLEDNSVTDAEDFQRHTDFYGSGNWIMDEKGDGLTFYGYSGSAWLSPSATDQPFHRVGIFGNVYGRSTKFTAGYLTGSDDDVNNRSLDNSGYFAQVEHLFTEKWAGYVRYDRIKRDLSGGGSQTLSGPTVGISWWAETQIRLTFEGQFISRTDEDNDNLFMTEFMWIF